MQARFRHWNWSGLQVTLWHLTTLSSLPPGQSLSPSQTQDWWIQVSLSSHSNSRGRQCDVWVGRSVQPISSDPSWQSASPSQRHLNVMQKFSEQLNSVVGLQGVLGQSLSSEPSPQSSSRSQTQRLWMHLPFPQVNSSERQVSSGHAQEETHDARH